VVKGGGVGLGGYREEGYGFTYKFSVLTNSLQDPLNRNYTVIQCK
jgi:hypothetical protein